MQTLRCSLVVAIVTILTSLAFAINVGDSPRMELSTLSDGVVRLTDLRGRAVLVHFWAPDGNGQASLESLNKLRVKYGPRGLVVIGDCMTDQPVDAQRIIKDQHIDWPQHIDPESNFANGWGVGYRLYAVLIGPDGRVVWHGVPEDATGAVEQLYQQAAAATAPAATPSTQPGPSESDLREATATLDRIDAAIKQDQPGEAMRLLSNITPSVRRAPTIAPRIKPAQDKIAAVIESALTEADLRIGEQKYAAAASKLRPIANAPSDLPAAAKARQMLLDLLNKPAARAQIEKDQKSDRAQQALIAAKKLQADGKDELAYARFKSIVSDFPDTPTAAEAQQEIKTYESNTKFMQSMAKLKLAQARSALSLAESYRRSGKIDLAKAKYQEVIDQFPGTKEAETAAAALAELKN